MCVRTYLIIVPQFLPSPWGFSSLMGNVCSSRQARTKQGSLEHLHPYLLSPALLFSIPTCLHAFLEQQALPCSFCLLVLTLHARLLHLFPFWCLFTPSARVFWTIVRKEELLPFIPCQSWGAVAMAEHPRLGGCVEQCCIWAYTSGPGRHHLLGFQ